MRRARDEQHPDAIYHILSRGLFVDRPMVQPSYRLVNVKNTNVFLDECPRRFSDSDSETLHTSSVCHCEDLTCRVVFV